MPILLTAFARLSTVWRPLMIMGINIVSGFPAVRADENRDRWLMFGLVAAALLSRLPLLPGFLQDHDAVNFALALEHFDLAHQQPHFPGYPVYIAVARLFSALGASASVALSLPGVLAGAAASALVFATLRQWGRGVALVGAALYLAVPGIWQADLTATSDALGLHLVTAAACLLVGGARPVLAALLLTLLLGVRLSYLPLSAGGFAWLLWSQPTRRGHILLAGLTGGLAWLVPLVVIIGGPVELWRIGHEFVSGHFTTWGNTAAGQGTGRATAFMIATWRAFGPVTLLIIGVGLAARSAGRPWRPLLAMAAPYAVWVAWGQNPEHARHLLPLAALGLLYAVPRLAELATAPRPILLAVTGAGILLSAPGAIRHSAQLPVALQGLEWITQGHSPEDLQIYTGSEARLFQYYAPAWRVARVTSAQQFRADLSERGRPQQVFILSTAFDTSLLAEPLEPVASFRRGDEVLTVYSLPSPEYTGVASR